MQTMTPNISKMAHDGLVCVREMAVHDGKLPCIAALRSPHAVYGLELNDDQDWANDAHRAAAVRSLRKQCASLGARTVLFSAPDASQPDVQVFYLETMGASWIGHAPVECGDDGTPNVLEPQWADGKASTFYPLLAGNPIPPQGVDSALAE